MDTPFESILARLEADGGPAPRMRLRDADSEETLHLGEITLRETGRYEVLGEIAVGGVGQVAKGRDVDLGRDVALKVIREDHLDNPDIVRRFVEEAQIGGQLQHPGIVPVYEMGLQADQRPFFAMKLVKGHTLTALLAARREVSDDSRRFLRIFEQVCRTVAYAHARGVIHRDLKPSNVMVGAFGEVQVLDWGFAKVLAQGGVADERRAKQVAEEITLISTVRSEGIGSESIPGSVMGTPAYMPPEQALGHVDSLDERSDVFSLGAVLAEILTGKPPYTGDGREQLISAAKARLEDAWERLDACAADPDLVKLAKACLSPLRTERPNHAGLVADAVSRHLAAAEERAHRAELRAAESRAKAERARDEAEQQKRKRRQTVALAGAALLVLLVAGAGFLWISADRRAQKRRSAEAVREVLREATLLRGRGEAERAWRAAKRGLALARGSDVEEDLAVHAEDLVREFEREVLATCAAAERERRDAEMIAALERIRVERGDRFEHRKTEASYAEAFRRYGIDVDGMEPVAAANAIGTSPISDRLVLALDEWAWVRKTYMPDREADRLLQVARRADPDPWRNRLRDAIQESSVKGLKRLAAADDLAGQSVGSLDLLAILLRDGRSYGEAVEVLEVAWSRHPDDFWINYHLALFIVLRDKGEIDAERGRRVERSARAALAIRPESYAATRVLGIGLSFQDRHEEAKRLLRTALERSGERAAFAHAALAQAFFRQGEREESFFHYREAARLAPEEANFRQNLAVSHWWRKEWDDAVEQGRRAVKLDPEEPLNLSILAQAIEERDGPEAARPYWEDLLDLARRLTARNPDDLQAWRQMLKLRHRGLLGQREFDRAVRETLRLASDTPWLRLNVSWVLFRDGRFEDALVEARRARADSSQDFWRSRTLQCEGAILDQMNRSEEALTALNAAHELEPGWQHLRKSLGAALVLTGRFEEGAAALKGVLEDGTAMSDDDRAYVERLLRQTALEPKLEDIRAGRLLPSDNEERILFADACDLKGYRLAAARLYREVLDIEPERALEERYFAARLAVDAGDEELSPLGAEERAEWRARALAWFEEELAQLKSGEPALPAVRKKVAWLRHDPRLRPVRGKKAVARLPEAERDGWRAFWKGVEQLHAEVSAK